MAKKAITKNLLIGVFFSMVAIAATEAATIRTIDVNQTYADNLANAGEMDHFSFTLTKAGMVNLDFTHENLLDPDNPRGWKFSVFNSNLDELTGFYSTYNQTKTTSCDIGLPAGTYYVKITATPYYSGASYGLKINYTH